MPVRPPAGISLNSTMAVDTARQAAAAARLRALSQAGSAAPGRFAPMLDGPSRAARPQAGEGVLLARLPEGKDASHVAGMQDELKTRLAALFESAPPELAQGLGIYSGYRSIEHQQRLWDASDKTGRWVARPGSSQHNHGNAADLSWEGRSLKHAPAHVIDWVHGNAAAFGLKFPMSYEPWHVEVQETRGGADFGGSLQMAAATSSASAAARDPAAPLAATLHLGDPVRPASGPPEDIWSLLAEQIGAQTERDFLAAVRPDPHKDDDEKGERIA